MKMKMQKALLNVLMVEANRQMQKLNRKAVRAEQVSLRLTPARKSAMLKCLDISMLSGSQ